MTCNGVYVPAVMITPSTDDGALLPVQVMFADRIVYWLTVQEIFGGMILCLLAVQEIFGDVIVYLCGSKVSILKKGTHLSVEDRGVY